MSLSRSQRAVLMRMFAGRVVSTAVLAGGAFLMPLALIPASTSSALAWLLALAVPLLVAIAALARHRFLTPADIDGSGLTSGTDRARVLQSIVQNTLEQTIVAAIVYVGWAMTMPANHLGVIPAAACLFLTGRALFAMGYSSGAAARALGFALTFYPTLLMCGWAMAMLALQAFQR